MAVAPPQVEKCSFTPLVYSTGGMAPRATNLYQRVAKMMAEKRQESYSDVVNVMRTKLAFVLLRSVLMSVRGARGKRCSVPVTPISCTSFNLIPEGLSYGHTVPHKLNEY